MAEKQDKKSKKDKKENDVIVKNTIELNPKIEEEVSSTAVFTFGRMNPPTIGHEKLVKKIEAVAKQNNAMPHIYLSQSYDSKKNPLPYKTKIALAKRAFGKSVVQSAARTVMEVAKELQDMGHKKLIMVVGSDRVNEFRTLLNKYNGRDYEFDNIEVVSAGERDPDADGAEGMSASKMRDAVSTGNQKAFATGLPSKLKKNATTIFNAVRTGMKIAEEIEAELGEEYLIEAPLTLAQRRKRGLATRRARVKILRGRKIAQRKMASKEKLKVRARRKAIQFIRRRVAGAKGADYANLSPSEKIAIDKRVQQRKGAIAKIATRLMPKVTKAERERLRAFMASKNEENLNDALNIIMEAYFKVDIEGLPPVFMTGPSGGTIKQELRRIIKKADENVTSIERVQRADIVKAFRLQAQGKSVGDDPVGVDEAFEMMLEREDKDIGDREGAQPAKYHSGLAKSTKEKRDRQFKKGAEKDSGDPSAYPEKHAGDEGVKTKTSVHTKRYHQMFSKENATKLDGRFRYNKKVTEEKDLFEEIDNMLEDITNDLFEQMLEEKSLEGLKKKAEKSGIPYGILKKVYDRGMAAWRTGHRPGASQEQWAYARVNSFITKGKGTWGKADADLARQVTEAKNHSWRSEGHYLENGEEWDGDQHAYEGEVYTGKEHGPDSKRLYHYKELPANIRAKIDAKLGEAVSPAQQAAIAIAKKKSGKYDEDGKKIKEEIDLEEKKGRNIIKSLLYTKKGALRGSEAAKADREEDKVRALRKKYREVSAGERIAKAKEQQAKIQKQIQDVQKEDIAIQLERDKDQYVLHMKEVQVGKKGKVRTVPKGRVELRGKKDYEGNGYDPKDKLHRFLDTIGKGVNMSDLMNGNVAVLADNNPRAKKGLAAAKKLMGEEIEHDKCGTPDCCGECDTATQNLDEAFTAMISDTMFANEFQELHVKAGFSLHPSVDEANINLMLNKDKYKKAAKIVRDMYNKDQSHSLAYWAAEVIRANSLKLDARTLAKLAEEYGAGEEGTDELVNKYKKDTPGQ